VIAAHGNSLRALIKYLENVPDDEIVNLNIPTARPMVYEFDSALKPVGRRYLGDAAEIEAAMAAVAAQGRAKPG
jgi:2,3-bisphosphoglycerate-dependent phosphoglycerate mutase